MTIEMSSNDTLKVILDRNDMRRLNITFEELDYENQATRSILKELLTDAGRLAGFSSKCTRMLIEVFPAPDGGCLLYFTKLSASRQTLSSVSGLKIKKEASPAVQQHIFEFACCDDLLTGTDFILRQKIYEPPARSSLYERDSAYRLVLGWDLAKRDAQSLLCEFARYVGQGAHAAAETAEHWRLVCAGDALEKMRVRKQA